MWSAFMGENVTVLLKQRNWSWSLENSSFSWKSFSVFAAFGLKEAPVVLI